VNSESPWTDAAAFVAYLFGAARGDVAWREVSVARIFAFEIVVAVLFGDLPRVFLQVGFVLWHPHAAVIAQRFGHQRQLRLVIARHGNTGRMDLRVTRVRKCRAFFMRAPDRRDVRSLRVRAQEE